MHNQPYNGPLLSVIVPVYNVCKYLRQSLDSVLAQTYANLQVLVVDDGSTDGSGSICEEYAARDARFTVFHTDNQGLSGARNYALEWVASDYVAFLDSDDWLERRAYEVMLGEAMSTDADIVTCRFFHEYVNSTGESGGPTQRRVLEGDEILRTYLMGNGVDYVSHDAWNKLYKASLFDGVRYPVGRIFEDISTTYMLLRRADRLVYVPDSLVHYRNRTNSLSNVHSMKSLVDYWRAYHERFEELGPLCEEYRRRSLSACIEAVSRAWRWCAGCTREEWAWARKDLDEMRRFAREHRGEVLRDPAYSVHARLTCLYAQGFNPVLLRCLYLLTMAYRSRSRYQLFEE